VFFDSWLGLLRVVIIGAAAYAALIVLLRISGKRTLGKMNAFDLVVTVALGSAFATVVLDKSVPLTEGVLAFALLIALQFGITWLSVRSVWVRSLVKSEPTLLVNDGNYLEKAMREQRVTQAEIEASLRDHGLAAIDQARCVVLETDGSLTVVGAYKRGTAANPVARKTA
jgi:uncharacterized membrane protein YcaP (DUF421 family)